MRNAASWNLISDDFPTNRAIYVQATSAAGTVGLSWRSLSTHALD
jgi:hypothetical protein